MKYIKHFENRHIHTGYFWYIDGDFDQILEVLEKYNEIHPEHKHDMKSVLNSFNEIIESRRREIVGIYFGAVVVWKGYDDQNTFHSFYNVDNEEDKERGYNTYNHNGQEYGGIMKIKGGELYIDTIEIDVKKYNI
jgi:hypothetical protein